jgi:6-pyruvoyltetrahydropterin/6-carboxytetrahydropterin synthase
MGKFQATKVYDGFSCVFRQWRAEDTHCKFLHGYSVSFKIIFEGDLDERNWVWDFGGMKRAKGKIDGLNPKQWFDYMFDHTTLIAKDDPYLDTLMNLELKGIIQLRILPSVGAEKFAQYVYDKVNTFITQETDNRVRIFSVEAREHEKNSAIYYG